MTFVLSIVKSILATQRNDFGFNKFELKSLNNVGYCGKKTFAFLYIIISVSFDTILDFLNICGKIQKAIMYKIERKRHNAVHSK